MIKFSVIIPTYNRRDFLRIAVDSVLNQTYSNLELIIIDDGSDDGTKELIDGYYDSRLKYIYQDNYGVSRARNRALSIVSGDYVAFLDSDDRWLACKLETVRRYIKENPLYYIFHTQEKWYRNGEHLNHMKKHAKKSGYIFENCLRLCSISISTAVVKREIFDNVGIFDEELEVCEDYDFWLRASAKYPVYLIDKILTLKDGGHPDQLSGRWGMDRFRIKSICKLLETAELDENQYSAVFDELKRKCEIYASGCFKRGKKEEGEKYLSIIEKYGSLNNA